MLSEIPMKYDRFMGPLFFRPTARFFAKNLEFDGNVLDLACGTGIVSGAILAEIPHASMVGLDSSASMLRVAQAKQLKAGWVRGEAEHLPFPNGAFSATVCSFGLMFVGERARAFAEIRRVLDRGGRFHAVLWGPLEENPIASTTDKVGRDFYRADPPPFFEKPFSLSGKQVVDEMQAAGFGGVELHKVALENDPLTPEEAATGLLEGNPILRAILDRGSECLPGLKAKVANALRSELGDPVRCTYTVELITGEA